MHRESSERKVSIKKGPLLEKIKENRIDHEKIYKEAMAGYQRECVKFLIKKLADAQAGEVSMRCDLVRPFNNLKEYDRIISMLEWCEDELIELTQHEFSQYVLDQWEWQERFLTSNSVYSARAFIKMSE